MRSVVGLCLLACALGSQDDERPAANEGNGEDAEERLRPQAPRSSKRPRPTAESEDDEGHANDAANGDGMPMLPPKARTQMDAGGVKPARAKKPARATKQSDGGAAETAEKAIAELDPKVTARYGEVVWAKLGGYPWWPGYVYDPRHLKGQMQSLALKNPAKKYLVYFYEAKNYGEIPHNSVREFKANIGKYKAGVPTISKAQKEELVRAMRTASEECDRSIYDRVRWNRLERPEIGARIKLYSSDADSFNLGRVEWYNEDDRGSAHVVFDDDEETDVDLNDSNRHWVEVDEKEEEGIIEQTRGQESADKADIVDAGGDDKMTENKVDAEAQNKVDAEAQSRSMPSQEEYSSGKLAYEFVRNDLGNIVVISFRQAWFRLMFSGKQGTLLDQYQVEPNETTPARPFKLGFDYEVCVTYADPLFRIGTNNTKCMETRTPEIAGNRTIEVSQVITSGCQPELIASLASTDVSCAEILILALGMLVFLGLRGVRRSQRLAPGLQVPLMPSSPAKRAFGASVQEHS